VITSLIIAGIVRSGLLSTPIPEIRGSVFVRRLVERRGDAGSVVVYNQAFEADVNTSLAEWYQGEHL
jgi:hypothetical protein